MKKRTIILSIALLILALLAIDIYNVNSKQNELLETIAQKDSEIAILRSKGDIDKRYPAIVQHNEIVKDYNICVQIIPNNIYNKVLLGKTTTDYLIR